MDSINISMVGVGNMGSAMISSWINCQIIAWEQLHLFDPHKNCQELFPKAKSYDALSMCVANGELVFICVKPKDVLPIVKEIADLRKNHSKQNRQVIISIAAGISLKQMIKETDLLEIVRAMPNSPLLVGEGAVALSFGDDCTKQTRQQLNDLFKEMGEVVVIEEELMDAVTGLSGSGPAFIYILIEAMADAGVAMGLNRDDALKLAGQTVYGAAKMVKEHNEPPSVLKDRVASPGGTTISGIRVLEDKGFRSAIQSAIEAATLKSKSLSRCE